MATHLSSVKDAGGKGERRELTAPSPSHQRTQRKWPELLRQEGQGKKRECSDPVSLNNAVSCFGEDAKGGGSFISLAKRNSQQSRGLSS